MLLTALVAPVSACGGHDASTVPGKIVAIRTLPGLDPPKLTVTHAAAGVAPGYLFVAEKKGGKEGGPVIADDTGRIVWYHQLPQPLEATDFRPQVYRGKPVLTWWEGRINLAGVGRGSYVIYDSAYQQIATVHAGHGLDGDLHEFQLTPRNTALIPAYHEVTADLSGIGGPKHGWVLDSVVQEVDVASGQVVFEWHSLDHVPLAESMEARHEPAKNASKKRPLDYFHVNSIADAPGGDLLISGRNTSTIYEIARDGHIVWRLGGKHSDFGPAAAVKFAFQHNARLHPGNLLTLFDNGAIPKVEPYSRALILKLDVAHKRAQIVKAFVHPKKLLSPFEGNVQLLPDGGAVVGWGGIRRVTEFGPGGAVRFELKLPFGDTYRGFRYPWRGLPGGAPTVDVASGAVYVSWNGATGIARWDVLAGSDAAHLSRIANAKWSGLETVIPLPGNPKMLAVEARDAAGRVLGRSKVVTAS